MNTRLVSLINMLCTLTPCSLGQAATDGAIEGCEKRLGVRFPSQLKAWLKTFNGMRAPPGNFYGISPNCEGDCIEEMMESDFPDYRSRKWIPVAGDGCGNHYVIPYGADVAPILFVATTSCHDAAAYVVASDLEHFLELVFEHEIRICKGDLGAFTPDWPFDEQFVRERDPQIARFNSVPLPWETKNRKPSSSKVKIQGQRKSIKTADAATTLSRAVIALLQEIDKDARCRILGKATEAAFRRVEKRQQYVIPDDLRTWLLHFNGVQIGTSGLLGVETWDNDDLNMEEIVSIRYTDIGRQHLWPIATDSPGVTT